MKTRTILIAALACLIALPALARPGRHKGPGPRGPNPAVMEKTMKEAGLSDGQIRRIQNLHLETQRAQIDLRAELEKGRLEMQQLMQDYNVKESAVMAQVDKLAAIKVKIKKNELSLRLKVRKEMTQEQFDKFRSLLMDKRQKFHRQHRGFGPGPQGGPGPGFGPGPQAGPGPGLE